MEQHRQVDREVQGLRRVAARAAVAAAAVAALLASGCGGPRRPPAPKPDRDPLALAGGPGAPAPKLEDLLALHPLGDRPFRADLLARDDERSVFLVQTRRGVPRHLHRAHRERAWVLAGSGTFHVEDRTYPAVPGSAFRIEAGTAHHVVADGDAPLVAIAVFEPPMDGIDDDRVPLGD